MEKTTYKKTRAKKNSWGRTYIDKYIYQYNTKGTIGYLVFIHRHDLKVNERFETLEKALEFRNKVLAECEKSREMKALEQINAEYDVSEYPENAIKALELDKYTDDMAVLIHDFDTNYDWVVNEFEKSTITDKEDLVFRLRYKEHKTLEETGKVLDVTRERIRQIETKAIKKLRRYYSYLIYGGTYKSAAMKEFEAKKQDFINELTYETAKKFVEDYEKAHFIEMNVYPSSIDELDLSVRSFNCLYRSGIKTVGQLSHLTIDDLYKIKNLGKRSALEIADKFHTYTGKWLKKDNFDPNYFAEADEGGKN